MFILISYINIKKINFLCIYYIMIVKIKKYIVDNKLDKILIRILTIPLYILALIYLLYKLICILINWKNKAIIEKWNNIPSVTTVPSIEKLDFLIWRVPLILDQIIYRSISNLFYQNKIELWNDESIKELLLNSPLTMLTIEKEDCYELDLSFMETIKTKP